MVQTRKLLVRFDPSKKEPISGDFLIPRLEDGHVAFRGIKSGERAHYGMVAYVGREVTDSDLFTRLVDSGAFISNVDATLALLAKFVEAMKTVKIGNVVEAEPDGPGIKLAVVARSPSGFGK